MKNRKNIMIYRKNKKLNYQFKNQIRFNRRKSNKLLINYKNKLNKNILNIKNKNICSKIINKIIIYQNYKINMISKLLL